MAGRPRRPSRRSRPKISYEPVDRPFSQYEFEFGEGGQPAWDREFRPGGDQPQRPYDEALLDGPSGRPGYDTPLQRQYRRQYRHLAPGADRTLIPTRGDQLRRELQRDRSLPWGNDEGLVPHSTLGQTSDPQRPRTLAMGYDPEARELRIKFREGARYVYYDVPPGVWEEILGADSVGTYLDDHVVHSYMYDQETWNTR